MPSIQPLILAAGRGVRMGSTLPKPLIPVAGRPMIAHLLETVRQSDFLLKPIIVVSENSPIPSALGNSYQYVVQEKQGGTGQAVACARQALQGKSDHTLALYADQPFIQPVTLQSIVNRHIQENTVMTVTTLVVQNFIGSMRPFNDYGRIIRDATDALQAIVEYKDATDEQRAICEVNTSFFCFKSSWLWENIKFLKPSPVTGEWYLTKMVAIAREQNLKVATYQISNPVEAMGINRKKDLAVAEEMLNAKCHPERSEGSL